MRGVSLPFAQSDLLFHAMGRDEDTGVARTTGLDFAWWGGHAVGSEFDSRVTKGTWTRTEGSAPGGDRGDDEVRTLPGNNWSLPPVSTLDLGDPFVYLGLYFLPSCKRAERSH